MAFGFKSINDSGTVQIDENHKCNMFKSKHTITTDTAFGNIVGKTSSYKQVTISGCIDPIIVLRSTGYVSYSIVGKSGTTWTYRFYAISPDASANTMGTSITYYVFDTNVTPSSSGFGLQVRDSTGALIYDSAYPVVKVVDFKTTQSYASAPATWSYPSGKTYGFTYSRPGSYSIETPSSATYHMLACANSGNNLLFNTCDWWSQDLGGSGPFLAFFGAVETDVLVIDVSNL